MTYCKKYGVYAIYTNGMIFKWFKTIKNAEKFWKENFTDSEMVEEWLEEYDVIELKNIKNNEVIHSIIN